MKRAEVIGVGTELLLGDIVNTNAAWIGRELATIGYACFRHTVVGDNLDRIAAEFRAATARADVVIVTGGLGPTQDDITREAFAAATGRTLARDASIEVWLRERFASFAREMPGSNLRQAEVPEGARVIDAVLGTAPGLIVEHEGTVFYLLPGVPSEMKEMMVRAVLPDLVARGGGTSPIVSRVVRTAGVGESRVAELLAPIWDDLESVTMAFLAGGGDVRVRLTSSAPDARARLDAATERVRAVLGTAAVGTDEQTLEVVIGELLRARGLTLGAAESLTGGALGARITSVAGSSAYFRGSIVAYASEVKTSVLGVDAALLARTGPVSEEVARAMATGVRSTLGSDVGVALTGVAGPGDHDGRAAGTVALAVDGPDGTVSREIRAPGDRAMVRAIATGAALNLARLYLLGDAWPGSSSPSR